MCQSPPCSTGSHGPRARFSGVKTPARNPGVKTAVVALIHPIFPVARAKKRHSPHLDHLDVTLEY
jgi:hypothetical protein